MAGPPSPPLLLFSLPLTLLYPPWAQAGGLLGEQLPSAADLTLDSDSDTTGVVPPPPPPLPCPLPLALLYARCSEGLGPTATPPVRAVEGREEGYGRGTRMGNGREGGGGSHGRPRHSRALPAPRPAPGFEHGPERSGPAGAPPPPPLSY